MEQPTTHHHLEFQHVFVILLTPRSCNILVHLLSFPEIQYFVAELGIACKPDKGVIPKSFKEIIICEGSLLCFNPFMTISAASG